jgi:hypothetical protein
MAKKLTSNKAKEILTDGEVHGYPLTDKQKRFFGAIAGGAPIKPKSNGWLNKFDDGGPIQENYNDYSVSAPEGFQGDGFSNVGRNYSPAWGGQFEDGGDIPTDKKSQKFYGMLKDYYSAPERTEQEKAQYAAFNKLNEKYGYAPVGVKNRTIMGKRSMINPLNGRLNLVADADPEVGEIKSTPQKLMDQYLEEYSHYQQYNENPEESKLKKTGRFLGHMAKDFGQMIKNTKGLNFKKGYDKNYVTPGTTEYEAHKVIQPKLKKELDDTADQLFQDRSNMAMGGSIPGSVGFTYARTVGAAPSNGPYAKKTLPSAQNGQEMKYYQEGLDWQPKMISRDGMVLAQEGKLLPKIGSKEAYELEKARQNRSDNTRAVPAQVKGTRESLAEERKQELAERAKKRKDPGTFSKGNYAIEESLRAFPESQGGLGELFDETINPAYFIGRMASNLGNAGSKAYNTGDFSDLPLAIGEPLVAGAFGLDPLGSAMKVPGRVAQSMESGVLSNMPDITAIKNYPKELRLASKEAGKLTLPKYKDIYRMEPTSWTKDKLDPLSGRWFTDKPAELNFYLNNLKDENPLVNARLLKERVPERVWKERFGENMPLEAKQKSMGTGNFATMDDIINSKTVSPEAARDLYNGFNSELTWSEVQKSPSLFNPSEGIISDYDAYRLRGLKSNKPLSPYTKIETSREQMPNVLNNVFKEHFEKTKFGIPKKYVPFEKGGVIKDDMGYWNPDNHGKVVEISSPDITMEGVDQPLLGISDTGDTKLMQPGKNYKFKGKKVTEYPVAKNGVNQQDQKTLEHLDQLTNFTNYNKPQPGGWLNKYN